AVGACLPEDVPLGVRVDCALDAPVTYSRLERVRCWEEHGTSMEPAGHADFARLIAPHAEALFRAAYRLTGNRADAEDLVQDVCVRAFANLRTLEALDRPKAWLLKIQYRVFIDGARRRRRSPLRATAEDLDASCASSDPTLEEIAEGSLAERRI